jgi:hypothetical protein
VLASDRADMKVDRPNPEEPVLGAVMLKELVQTRDLATAEFRRGAPSHYPRTWRLALAMRDVENRPPPDARER